MYYYLKDGEIPRPGDEYFCPRLGWRKRTSTGLYPYYSKLHYKVRRKVPTLREKIIGAF